MLSVAKPDQQGPHQRPPGQVEGLLRPRSARRSASPLGSGPGQARSGPPPTTCHCPCACTTCTGWPVPRWGRWSARSRAGSMNASRLSRSSGRVQRPGSMATVALVVPAAPLASPVQKPQLFLFVR